jgi:hypothetical protein
MNQTLHHPQRLLPLTIDQRLALLDRLDAAEPSKGHERRRSQRYSYRQIVELEVQLGDDKMTQWYVHTRTLSAGGMSFLLHVDIEPGLLCMAWLIRLDHRVHPTGAIVRSAREVAPEVFEIGVQFGLPITVEDFILTKPIK